MARPFSYPEVAALEVGQAARVDDNPTAIRRKVNEYAKRSEKLFSIARLSGCQSALVTRLEITNVELPDIQ